MKSEYIEIIINTPDGDQNKVSCHISEIGPSTFNRMWHDIHIILNEYYRNLNKKQPIKLSDAAIRWLANGDRGRSSNTLFTILSGIDCMKGYDQCHPLDAWDFIRCEKLLIAVPEFRSGLFSIMYDVDMEWSRLVSNWDRIKNTIELEMPGVFEHPRNGVFKTAHGLIGDIIHGRK